MEAEAVSETFAVEELAAGREAALSLWKDVSPAASLEDEVDRSFLVLAGGRAADVEEADCSWLAAVTGAITLVDFRCVDDVGTRFNG